MNDGEGSIIGVIYDGFHIRELVSGVEVTCKATGATRLVNHVSLDRTNYPDHVKALLRAILKFQIEAGPDPRLTGGPSC